MGLSEQIEEILKILSKSAAGDFDAARQLALAVQPQFKDQSRAKRKSIGRTKMMEIFLRDGFVDQYTGERLFFPGTLLVLGKQLPTPFAVPQPGQGWRIGECHWIYWRLWPTVEHLDPVSRGGHNDTVERLITTSQMANSARGAWAPDEVPESIRIERFDYEQCRARRWDGMMQWFVEYTDAHPEVVEQDKQIQGWKKAALAAKKTQAWETLVDAS